MGWEGYAWIAWMVTFVVLETIALVRKLRGGTMTLTYFTEHHVPRWMLAAFLGWLSFHFLIDTPAMR